MIEELEKIGFTRNEAKVYISLLDIGNASAGEISKKAQVNRTNTYDCLDRLLEKGLIKYHIESNRKVFSPNNPENIIKNIESQKENASKIIPNLSKIYKEKEQHETANIYRGRKGIKTVFYELLQYEKYDVFGSSGKIMETMQHDFIVFQQEKKRKGIKSRIIQPQQTRKNKEFLKATYSEFRYIPSELMSPVTTIIYGNKIATLVWAQTPIAFVLESKEAANAQRKYFELLWSIAKP